MNLEELDKINIEGVAQEMAPKIDIKSRKMGDVDDFNRYEIDKDIFGYAGKFYPASWRFFHKPLKLSDIRMFSAVDEKNPRLLYNAYNDLIKSTLIITETVHGVERYIPNIYLYEHDRIAYILALHQNTKGEVDALTFEYGCENCTKHNKVLLQPYLLKYEEISDKFLKYHLQDGPIEAQLKDGSKKILKPLTIQRSLALSAYINKLQQQNKQIDTAFLKMYHVLAENIVHKDVEELYRAYINLESDRKTNFLYQYMSDNSVFTLKPIVEHECSCRFCNEHTLDLTGITAIFNDNSVADLFA